MLKFRLIPNIHKAVKCNCQKRKCKHFLLEMHVLDHIDATKGMSAENTRRLKQIEVKLNVLRKELGQKNYNRIYNNCLQIICKK